MIDDYDLRCEFHSERWINNSGQLLQPDLFLVFPSRIVLFEFKLTFTLEGIDQLLERYAPVLYAIFSRPVVCVLACRNLTPHSLRYESVASFADCVKADAEGPFVMHIFDPKEITR